MIFEQFLNGDLGCASYLIGCDETGEAVVVDPPYAIEPVLEEAERRGARIVRVIETHTHADHLSGHGRLALGLEVPVSIHPAAEVAYPHDDLRDGDEISVGSVTLRCLHTPGHRPEHCCLAVTSPGHAIVLTGDSLFVGDAARPDLAVGANEGATGLFHSLQRLLELPDELPVFPGHVAGSLCGKRMSSVPSTTIGVERGSNPMLQLTDVDAFIAESASISAPKPPNLERIVDLNCGPFLGDPVDVPELALPPDGAQPLDVRAATTFFAGHRKGAINVPVDGTGFATKAGFVLDAGAPVVVLASSSDEAARAIRGLHSVGFLDIAGFVVGAGEEHVAPVSLDELETLLSSDAEVIDVREKDERDEGYIPGSRNVPYRLLRTCCPDLPRERPVVTICESGARAAVGASLLRARGYDARPVLEGGMTGWLARGGETIVFRRCGSH